MIHDSTRRRDFKHPGYKSLPQPPDPFISPDHAHQLERASDLAALCDGGINLSPRLTHIERLCHECRKRPTHPSGREGLFEKTSLAPPAEDFVVLEFVAQVFVPGPVYSAEGHVTPERQFQAPPEGADALFADEGGDSVEDGAEGGAVFGRVVRL